MALITLIIQSTFCTNCGPEQFGMIPALCNPQATDLWASELGRTLQRIDRDLGRQQVCLIVPLWKQTPKEVALKADWYFSLTHRAYLQNCLEIWLCLYVLFLVCSAKNYCRLQNRHMALMALIGQSTFCTKPSTMAQKCLQNSGNMSHEQIHR